MADEKVQGFWATAVISNGNLVRAVVLVGCSMLFLGLTIFLVGRKILTYISQGFPDSEFELAYVLNENKVLFASRGPGLAYVSVSASAGWVDTGIQIKPGKSVKVKAVGHANLALKELYTAISEDRRPRFQWYEPDGRPCEPSPDGGPNTCAFTLAPTENIGSLLAYVRPPGTPAPSFANPRPKGIQGVGAEGSITNMSSANANLYLSLNDIILPNNKEGYAAYLAGNEGEDLIRKKKQWPALVNDHYWSLWFDDNVGQYLVQIDARSN